MKKIALLATSIITTAIFASEARAAHHDNIVQVQEQVAQYAAQYLRSTGASTSVVQGVKYKKALRNNIKKLRAQGVPESVIQAIVHSGNGGSFKRNGQTRIGCLTYCWERTQVFVKDPWYVIGIVVGICEDDCVTPTPSPHATATPTPPPSPTPTPTSTVRPTPTPTVTPTPTETPTPTPSPTATPGCTFVGFWQCHPELWCFEELPLGDRGYTVDEVDQILHYNNGCNGHPNGLLQLAKALIIAKLNVQCNHAPADCISQTIADSDTIIGNQVIPPIGNGCMTPEAVSNLVMILNQYNFGHLCAPPCVDPACPTPTPTATP